MFYLQYNITLFVCIQTHFAVQYSGVPKRFLRVYFPSTNLGLLEQTCPFESNKISLLFGSKFIPIPHDFHPVFLTSWASCMVGRVTIFSSESRFHPPPKKHNISNNDSVYQCVLHAKNACIHLYNCIDREQSKTVVPNGTESLSHPDIKHLLLNTYRRYRSFSSHQAFATKHFFEGTCLSHKKNSTCLARLTSF